MSLMPLIFFELLADAKLSPMAARLHVSESDSSGLLPLCATEDFRSLTSRFPNLIDDGTEQRLPAELSEAMHAIGIQSVAATAIQAVEPNEKPAMLPGKQWLSGDWYLAPPPRSTSTQAASRALSLKLMQLVATDADTCEIEAIFRQEPVLAYHLLRLVNSLGVGVGRHISVSRRPSSSSGASNSSAGST